MSITDELREWAEDNTLKDRVLTTCPPQHAVHGVLETLLRIADRIDAEHERLMQEQPFTIDMVPMTDENMAEYGWVRLPVDADGVHIRVGDAVTCGATVWTVTGLKFLGEGWGICCTVYNEYGGSGTTVYPPSELRHHHAPTVEDVLLELLDEAEHFHSLEEEREAIAEYAAKLRLAGDAE